MTVYYVQHPSGVKVTAFPKVTTLPFHAPVTLINGTHFTQGFRMITGDPMIRKFQYTDERSGEYWAKSFRCWQTTGPYDYSNSHAIGPGPFDTVHLPEAPCPGGIRSNTFFPA